MAFWNIWNRKKKTKDTQDLKNEEIIDTSQNNELNKELNNTIDKIDFKEQEKISIIDKNDQKRFVRDCCETAMENDRQIAAAKKEYEKITSHLTDIQKIDMISGSERKELVDLCKNIVNLVNERNRYKNRKLTITEAQMRKFEPYEEYLVDEIKKMYGAEAYQKAIESDISHLTKEKELLYKQQREIHSMQRSLKTMSKVLSILIISLFVLFIVIYYSLKVDMTLPYLGTVLLAAISATVIFVEANKNRRNMLLNGKKINKAIGFMNRVKIKYINNVNMMSYNREKYGVKSAKDFEEKWNEYCKTKEYERRFKESTDKLNFNSESLIDLLNQNNIADSDIWISQAIAIIDDREMVEIRHELNQARQMLRERIEYNEKVKADTVKQIDELITNCPDMQKELLDIVKEYSALGA